jgi:ribosomal protein S27E
LGGSPVCNGIVCIVWRRASTASASTACALIIMDRNLTSPVTDALQTKCDACGAYTQYSPAEENLKCAYCGHVTVLDKSAVEIKENDFAYWKDRADTSAEEMIEATEIKCRQCGANTTLPPNVSAAKCAFCGTPLIMNEASVKRFWQPEYMLPFKVTDKTCAASFKNWLAGKWLAPSKLKKSAVQTDSFKGVYMPFWTYDAATSTDYRGERGVGRRERFRNRSGAIEERTVMDWFAKNGTVNLNFDDVLVPASKTLPAAISNALTNWDLMNCVAYRKEFLAGFITEIYQLDFRAAIDDAKRQMDNYIVNEIYSDIGGDQQRIHSKTTQYNDLKFKLLLLPVWISAFRFKDKVYRFVVNGRTGQVTGSYPISAAKVTLIVLAIIVLIGFLYFWGTGG